MPDRIAIGDLVRHRTIHRGVGLVVGVRGFEGAYPVVAVRFLSPVRVSPWGLLENYRCAAVCWEVVSSCDI